MSEIEVRKGYVIPMGMSVFICFSSASCPSCMGHAYEMTSVAKGSKFN